MSKTLPLAPVTDEGLHDLQREAWDSLASWAATLASSVRKHDARGQDHCIAAILEAEARWQMVSGVSRSSASSRDPDGD
jgi:RecB family exonuclease